MTPHRWPHPISLHSPWRMRAGNGPPMEVTLPGLFLAHEPIVLSRAFQWKAARDPAERIFLVIEGVVGQTHVRLNGEEWNAREGVGKPCRFDVTEQIALRNTLELYFAPRNTSTLGIRDWIGLSIESAIARLSDLSIVTSAGSSPDALSIWACIEGADPHAAEFALKLDGETMSTAPIEALAISMKRGPLKVDAWQPRGAGLPVRHDLEVALRHGNDVLHHQSFKIGFHSRFAEERGDGLVLVPEGKCLRIKETLNPDATKDPDFATRCGALVADWEAADVLALEDHVATEAFYELMDRLGVRVWHRGRVTREMAEAISRRAHHPCVLLPPAIGQRPPTGKRN